MFFRFAASSDSLSTKKSREESGWPWLLKSMALKSAYLPGPTVNNGIIQITGEEHRHLVVARAERGELVEAFDGQGRVWEVEVVDVGKRQTAVRVRTERMTFPPKVQLILGQAMIRPAAFELALEKAVEIGVTRIVPFVAARSNVTASPRQDRWQRIIIEAAKQSKRFYLPALDAPLRFQEILQVSAATKIVFAERDGGPLKSALSGSPVLYLVGPEGGWSKEELESAGLAGFHSVTLGSGILRSETAAIVGASLIRYELGE